MSIIETCGGRRFNAEPGEAILDAALRSGVVLEHSCRTGRCSTCKAKVKSGLTAALYDETGLHPSEREAGWILTCARSAVSDLELEAEDLGNIRLHPAKTLPCRIQSLERLSSDVLKVSLRLPPNQQLDYHPGQYIDLIARDGLRRSYSVANASATDKRVELHIRQVPDGAMSRFWFDEAKPNDLLRLNGPLGTFFLRDAADLDLILLATGTGMAPIKAMLENLASASAPTRPRSISVYWGGRVPQDLYWNPAEIDLAFEYTPVLSRADATWAGARGHVQQAVLSSGLDLARAVVYACGSSAMIASAREQLVGAGLSARRFHSDAFVSSSQNPKENP